MRRQVHKHAASARVCITCPNLHVPTDLFPTIHCDELVLVACQRVHDVESNIVSDNRGRGFLPWGKFAFAAHRQVVVH
jgi:hypothetical protein